MNSLLRVAVPVEVHAELLWYAEAYKIPLAELVREVLTHWTQTNHFPIKPSRPEFHPTTGLTRSGTVYARARAKYGLQKKDYSAE